MTRQLYVFSVSLLSAGLLSGGMAHAATQTAAPTRTQPTGARELTVTQVARESINREAQKYTGHPCQGHDRVMDMIGNARAAHLKFAHDTLLNVMKARLGSRAAALVKSDFAPGQMGRIYADLSTLNVPSVFMMTALQPYQGQNHIIAYQCQLK